MWNDLLFSVNTVLPLMIMMLVGFAARRFGVIGSEGVRQGNSTVFRIFLPLLLCMNTMDAKLGGSVDVKTLLFAMAAIVLSYAALFALSPKVCGEYNQRGVFIQGVARSNYAIYGIPLVLMMYPNSDNALSALMVVAVVPLFNILATVALILYGEKSVSVWRMVRGVLLNPLIIGTLTGFILWRLNWQFPPVLDGPLRTMSKAATPLALFLLGASLDFEKVRANGRLLTLAVVGRLIITPLIFLGLAIALGIRGMSLAVLIAVFASPTAVSSYPMAQELGGDADFAAAQVVLTTTFSSLTVFLWIFALKAMGLVG